jgi:hypothetical protein
LVEALKAHKLNTDENFAELANSLDTLAASYTNLSKDLKHKLDVINNTNAELKVTLKNYDIDDQALGQKRFRTFINGSNAEIKNFLETEIFNSTGDLAQPNPFPQGINFRDQNPLLCSDSKNPCLKNSNNLQTHLESLDHEFRPTIPTPILPRHLPNKNLMETESGSHVNSRGPGLGQDNYSRNSNSSLFSAGATQPMKARVPRLENVIWLNESTSNGQVTGTSCDTKIIFGIGINPNDGKLATIIPWSEKQRLKSIKFYITEDQFDKLKDFLLSTHSPKYKN